MELKLIVTVDDTQMKALSDMLSEMKRLRLEMLKHRKEGGQ